MKLFLNGSDVISKSFYLELWRPSYSAELNHLCNFGRGHYGENSGKISVNLDQSLKEKVYARRMTDARLTTDKDRPQPSAQAS